jgi:hypothetical protein
VNIWRQFPTGRITTQDLWKVAMTQQAPTLAALFFEAPT